MSRFREALQVLLGVHVIYALSPQAKGKVERPFRWLQDRIVRTCVYEHLSTLEGARALQAEDRRCDIHQVHSTSGRVPNIRFERARAAGNTLFREFDTPQPYTSSQDVFCLREQRMVDGYRRISLFKHTIEVPIVPLRESVDVRLVPDETAQAMRIRIWWNDTLVHTCAPVEGLSRLSVTATGVPFSTLANSR